MALGSWDLGFLLLFTVVQLGNRSILAVLMEKKCLFVPCERHNSHALIVYYCFSFDILESHLSDLKIRHFKQGKDFVM